MTTGTALITGANRGIGLALVSAMQVGGWRVIATCRDPSQATALTKTGATILPLDVTDDASVASAAEAVPVIDALVNNAAVFPEEGNETLAEMNLAHFSEAFAANVVGVARVTRALLPRLRQSPHPRIVNVSSGAGSIGDKADFAYYAYSASKAALNMLTRAMAAEYRPLGIAVVALSPGWVRTEMGGPNAVLTPEESARAIAATIRRLDLQKSGQFIDRHGQTGEYAW